MHPLFGDFTSQTNFFGKTDPFALIETYGSPLYVYNEALLRLRCRELKELLDNPRFQVSYSAKVNSNLAGVKALLDLALQFDDLELIDLGGGFGVPYHKLSGQARLDLARLGRDLSQMLGSFSALMGERSRSMSSPGGTLLPNAVCYSVRCTR